MRAIALALVLLVGISCGSSEESIPADAKPTKIDISLSGIWDNVKLPIPPAKDCTKTFGEVTAMDGWVVHGGYTEDECGFIELYGLVEQTTKNANTTAMFILPETARPERDFAVPTVYLYNSSPTSVRYVPNFSYLFVMSSGDVFLDSWSYYPGFTYYIPYVKYRKVNKN